MSHRAIQALDANADTIYSEEPVAGAFQRLPRRIDLPDYYEIIKNTVAFSTVRVSFIPKIVPRKRATTAAATCSSGLTLA